MEELLTMYTLKDLSELEGRNPRTIKSSFRYLKVKLETGHTRAINKSWLTKKPYWVRYIRLEDIKKMLKGKVDISFTS